MLINTVLVFLKNALPALFFIAVTSSLLSPYSVKFHWKVWAIVVGMILATLLSQSMSFVAGLFDGMGFELLSAAVHLMLFLLLMVQIIYRNPSVTTNSDKDHYRMVAYLAGISLVLMLNVGRLLVFLGGYSVLKENFTPVLSGGIIGFGISLSSALILLYILRSNFLQYWIKAPLIAIVFMSARQLSELSLKLIQIDWLPSGNPVWDSSRWVEDISEAGRFFHALIGYESAPTISQAIFYCIGIMTPLLFIYFASRAMKQVKT